MSVDQFLKERRTVHQYKDQPVDDQLIMSSLETALFAPNHRHTKPWKFYWLNQEMRSAVTDLALQLKGESQELTEVKKKALKNKFDSPYACISLGQVKCDSEFQSREDYASVACGVQNIHLSLWEKGVASKWSTGAVTRHPEVYKMLSVNPEEVELVGFLWIGIADIVPKTPPKASLQQTLVRF